MRIFDNFAGIASILGLAAAVVPLVYFFLRLQPINGCAEFYDQYRQIFATLAISIGLLITSFALIVRHYTIRINQLTSDLRDLPLRNAYLEDELGQAKLVNIVASECVHNFSHYFRNNLYGLDHLAVRLLSGEEPEREDFSKAFEEFHSFMLLSLSSICSYFEKKTEDKCAASVKIIKGNKVKTFYRDPVSYRLRKRSDYNQDGSRYVYRMTDNYAFHVIANPDMKQTTFICDDLTDFPSYINSNPNWRNLYTACAVVPIQCRKLFPKYDPGRLELLGFLCVDNFLGGFEGRETEDFLSSFGDLLYPLLTKYDQVVAGATQKGVTSARTQSYVDWDDN